MGGKPGVEGDRWRNTDRKDDQRKNCQETLYIFFGAQRFVTMLQIYQVPCKWLVIFSVFGPQTY